MAFNFNVSLDAIASTRSDLLSAIASRTVYEIEQNSGERTAIQLEKYYNRAVKLDAASLSFAASIDLDWEGNINSHRRSKDRFNIYAITKVWEVSRILNGSAWGHGNDGMTCESVTASLAKGQFNQKQIACDMNEFAIARGCGKDGKYTSGATQASSSLRAMEALGIVKRVRKEGLSQIWGIADASLLALMCLANGIHVDTAPADDDDIATADSFDGITLDGEVFDMTGILALPAPAAPAAPAMLALSAPATSSAQAYFAIAAAAPAPVTALAIFAPAPAAPAAPVVTAAPAAPALPVSKSPRKRSKSAAAAI